MCVSQCVCVCVCVYMHVCVYECMRVCESGVGAGRGRGTHYRSSSFNQTNCAIYFDSLSSDHALVTSIKFNIPPQ